jgi:uncharacterized membrane protein YdjX (TVP38/TMEM64 family)
MVALLYRRVLSAVSLTRDERKDTYAVSFPGGPMMLPSSRRERVRLVAALALLGFLVGATIWGLVSGRLQHFTLILIEFGQDRAAIRDYLRSWGALAPIVFVSMQALQVVVAPVPGEITGFVGGFVFGTWLSVLYSTIGLTLGSALAFAAARIMGFPLVKLLVKEQTLEKLHFVTEPRGAVTAFLLFAIPGLPKDLLSYLLGLSPMRFTTFLLVCGLGRIPGTIVLALSGAALYKENWKLIAVLSGASMILLVILYFKGDTIREWLREKTHPHHDNKSL